LEARGFSAEVVDDLDAARVAVLARIPEGASVMTNPSVTLEATGLVQALDESGRYDSARARIATLDRATQLREIKSLMAMPDFSLGSVHAITREGTLVIASALGSQLASYSWLAEHVIFVVGAQKLVLDLDAARERIYAHCLGLEDARALETYGVNSRVGKLLEIRQEDPGRIHVVLIREPVGF
jgi:L-lactate utilization protein LutC